MPFNGSGIYSLPAGSVVSDGTTIDAADLNTPLADIESSLSSLVLKNGAAPFTANQSMGGNKLTNMADGTVGGDAATLRQVRNGEVSQATVVGGTVNAIALTFDPGYGSFVTGMRLRWFSLGQNTGPVTINVSGLGAKDLRKYDSQVLDSGDVPPAGALVEAVYNGTRFLMAQPYTVEHGSFTPTLSNVANIAARTAYLAMWSKNGRMVTVSGRVDITATAANTATELTMTLPFASDFSQEYECAGTLSSFQGYAGNISGATAGASDVARFRLKPGDTTSNAYFFIFQYRIL